MAKPTTLPRWADVGGAIVVPASGKLDVGWVTAERPPAQYMNWWMNLVYQWTLYLNQFFSAAGTATDAIHTSGVSNLDGLVTAGAGVTCAANQSMTVSGTGQYKHGTKTLILTPYNFGSPSGGVFSDISITGASLSVRAPIALTVGKRILAIRVTLTDNATGPTKLVVNLLSNVYGVGTSLVAASPVSAGTGVKQTLSINGLTSVMTAGTALTLAIVTSLGSASCAVHAAEIDFDEP